MRARPRSREVIEGVRGLIVERRLRPGEAIPTRRELAEMLRVSPASVHRGVTALIDAGFLVADGRRGTRVAEAPPHLFRYAVVLTLPAYRVLHSPHLTAVYRAAMDLGELAPRTFPVFLREAVAGGVHPLLGELPAEAAAGRLAGILLAGDAHDLVDYGLLEAARRVPVAAFDSSRRAHAARVLVEIDRASFADRAMAAVREAGLRRVAVLWCGLPQKMVGSMETAAARHGLTLRREWQQFVTPHEEGIPARLAVRLLSSGPRSRRPQALVIGDDSLTAAACRELATMGLTDRRDPFIVSHTNYPQPPGLHLPVRWLGFDAHEWFRTAVEALEHLDPDEPCRRIPLPARFLEEVEEAHREASDRALDLQLA